MKKLVALFGLLVILALMTSCTFKEKELGTKDNPIKLFFVPSVEAKTLADKSKVVKRLLEQLTPYHFEVRIPESYIAVVEAFGANRVDIAALNTFGYILAHEKFGAQALLTVVRYGRATYRSTILARADGKIKSLEDLSGKTIAYVDPASTSGYLLPLKELKEKEIETGKHIFAMTHDAVVSMIYKGRVDAGAAFYSPPEEGEIQDARRLVKTQYPDVEQKIKILHLTSDIPNEPVVFRKDMPDKMKKEVVEAFMKLIEMPEGKDAVGKLFGITELKASTDADYDGVRKMIKTLGTSAANLVKDAASQKAKKK